MKALENKTVLVAGGAGFIGSMVVRVLLYNGVNVVICDNLVHGRSAYIPYSNAVRFYNIDLCQKEKLARVVSIHNVDYIINCSGDTYVPAAYINQKRFLDTNTYSVLNLLNVTKEYGVKKMIHLSTTEVYGITEDAKINEEHMINPVNTYAVTKLAGDQLCKTMHI